MITGFRLTAADRTLFLIAYKNNKTAAEKQPLCIYD